MPGPPVIHTARLAGRSLTEALIMWSSPANPNGIIRKYQIETAIVSYNVDRNGELQVILCIG